MDNLSDHFLSAFEAEPTGLWIVKPTYSELQSDGRVRRVNAHAGERDTSHLPRSLLASAILFSL
jgi:hypothetical protein